jgi:hypothetical protein
MPARLAQACHDEIDARTRCCLQRCPTETFIGRARPSDLRQSAALGHLWAGIVGKGGRHAQCGAVRCARGQATAAAMAAAAAAKLARAFHTDIAIVAPPLLRGAGSCGRNRLCNCRLCKDRHAACRSARLRSAPPDTHPSPPLPLQLPHQHPHPASTCHRRELVAEVARLRVT